NKYLRALGPAAPVHSLKDVIAFNEREKTREMPFFGQEIMLMAEKKGPLTSPAYRATRATCRQRATTAGIDAVLAKYRLTAIVAPTGSPAWSIDPINADRVPSGTTTPAAEAWSGGVPVPAGDAHGLPVGLSFIGPRWSEAKLIALAYAFEQATKHRKPPQFLPTLAMQ